MIMLSDTYGFLHLPSRLEELIIWCIRTWKTQLFQVGLYLQQITTDVNSENSLASSVAPSHYIGDLQQFSALLLGMLLSSSSFYFLFRAESAPKYLEYSVFNTVH